MEKLNTLEALKNWMLRKFVLPKQTWVDFEKFNKRVFKEA